jgi:Skp family chaperone for outer membrane proteins
VTGCSSSPSEEELKALSDLKSEITSMEGELAKKQRELGDLQKKVAEQNGRLQQCQSDQEAVKKAMGGQ